jgi:hypothetical protein
LTTWSAIRAQHANNNPDPDPNPSPNPNPIVKTPATPARHTRHDCPLATTLLPVPKADLSDMAAASASPDSNHAQHAHELDNMADKKPSLPVEADVMQLARLGEIGPIQKLFDSGACDATYTDEQGITPLHVRTRLCCLHHNLTD